MIIPVVFTRPPRLRSSSSRLLSASYCSMPKVKKERANVRGSGAAVKRRSAPPINRLTKAILAQVFGKWADIDEHAPWTASLVSRQWRKAVLDSPGAWRHVQVDIPAFEEESADDMPLIGKISVDPGCCRPVDLWLERSSPCDVTLSIRIMHAVPPPDMLWNVVHYLVPHMRRIVAVRLDVESQIVAIALLGQMSNRWQSANRLRKLTLCIGSRKLFGSEDRLLTLGEIGRALSTNHSINSIELEGHLPPSEELSQLCSPTITTLTLTSGGQESEAEETFRVISYFPSLRRLVMDACVGHHCTKAGYTPILDKLFLPDLRHLHLRRTTALGMDKISSALRAWHLDTVHIHCQSRWDTDSPWGLTLFQHETDRFCNEFIHFARVNSNIHTLKFDCVYATGGHIFLALAHLDALESLILENADGARFVLEALASTKAITDILPAAQEALANAGSRIKVKDVGRFRLSATPGASRSMPPMLCPRLTHLELAQCPSLPGQMLVRLAQVRRDFAQCASLTFVGIRDCALVEQKDIDVIKMLDPGLRVKYSV